MISYKAAKVELQSAEASFKGYADLTAKNFISVSEFDRRVTVIEWALAKYEQAMEQMSFVTLRAIESGFLMAFNLAQGQLVMVKDVVGKMKVNDKSATVVTKNKSSMVLPATAIHSDGVSVYKLILDQDSKSIGAIAVAQG